MKPNKIVSIIIPVFNEKEVIASCLLSLTKQAYKPLEIIVVDDGSTDSTVNLVKKLQTKVKNLVLLNQKHLGPGSARNLGASKSRGEILVFVDADMTFEKNFIKDLIDPIISTNSIGTFSKNEFNANKDNAWSASWNINRNWPVDTLVPKDYPSHAPVFRAILKKEFAKVGGFDTSGQYTDDWSLSKKLKVKSTLAPGATYYHSNPKNLKEVWQQARWIGKSEFIAGSFTRKVKSLIIYSLPFSLVIGIYKSMLFQKPIFLVFKIWYDFAVFMSVIMSFFKESKSK